MTRLAGTARPARPPARSSGVGVTPPIRTEIPKPGSLKGKFVSIPATRGCERSERKAPRDTLKQAGAAVHVVLSQTAPPARHETEAS